MGACTSAQPAPTVPPSASPTPVDATPPNELAAACWSRAGALAAARGDHDAWPRDLERALAVADGEMRARIRHQRAWLLAESGDPSAAHDELRALYAACEADELPGAWHCDTLADDAVAVERMLRPPPPAPRDAPPPPYRYVLRFPVVTIAWPTSLAGLPEDVAANVAEYGELARREGALLVTMREHPDMGRAAMSPEIAELSTQRERLRIRRVELRDRLLVRLPRPPATATQAIVLHELLASHADEAWETDDEPDYRAAAEVAAQGLAVAATPWERAQLGYLLASSLEATDPERAEAAFRAAAQDAQRAAATW